jgi:hypothetical protein
MTFVREKGCFKFPILSSVVIVAEFWHCCDCMSMKPAPGESNMTLIRTVLLTSGLVLTVYGGAAGQC